MCVCARISCSPVVAVDMAIVALLLDFVLDVDEEPEDTGTFCCTPLVSSVVSRVVATAGDAAAVVAAAVQAGKERRGLKVGVAVAGVAVAVAVVAATTPDCLELGVPRGYVREAEVKMGIAKPGGSRGGSP